MQGMHDNVWDFKIAGVWNRPFAFLYEKSSEIGKFRCLPFFGFQDFSNNRPNFKRVGYHWR